MPQACNPSIPEAGQEDPELEASLDYTGRPCLKTFEWEDAGEIFLVVRKDQGLDFQDYINAKKLAVYL